MAKHTFPASTFEEESGPLMGGPAVYPEDAPDSEFRDPEYDDVFPDADEDAGSQEWRARSQK